MKFTNGYWLLRDDVQAHYAVAAESVTATAHELTIHAVTRRIQHRGDTLNSPLLSVHASAPMADIIRVRLSHFDGGCAPGPNFTIAQADAPTGEATIDGAHATLTSGSLAHAHRTRRSLEP